MPRAELLFDLLVVAAAKAVFWRAEMPAVCFPMQGGEVVLMLVELSQRMCVQVIVVLVAVVNAGSIATSGDEALYRVRKLSVGGEAVSAVFSWVMRRCNWPLVPLS